MARIKYSAIVGSLGQNVDRFVAEGYKEDSEIRFGFENEVDALAGLGCLDALDIYYAEEGINSDAEATNAVLDRYGLVISSTFTNLFGRRKWKNGSLSSTDEKIRQAAIELCKKNSDFNKKLKGTPPMTLWLGQDGFDYPFQTDYGKSWMNLIDSVQQVCDHNPEVMVTLEAKPREPRNRTIVDTVANSLLMCEKIDRKNVGVSIDMGHIWNVQQNIAQTVALASEFGRLVTMHANDNYGVWDDDMIAGTIHHTEYLEMFYFLKKYEYDGNIAVDIFPYRENTLGCTKETVLNLKKFEALVDMIGMDRLGELIAEGDPVKTSEFMRETIYRI